MKRRLLLIALAIVPTIALFVVVGSIAATGELTTVTATITSVTPVNSGNCTYLASGTLTWTLPGGSSIDHGCVVIYAWGTYTVHGLLFTIGAWAAGSPARGYSYGHRLGSGDVAGATMLANVGNQLCHYDATYVSAQDLVDLGCEVSVSGFETESTFNTVQHVTDCGTGCPGGTPTYRLENIRLIIEAPPPPPPPPPPDPIYGSCTFTTTVVVTSTNPISPGDIVTGTQIVTYTRPANLVPNYGFEQPNPNGPGPASWSPVVGGTSTGDVPQYYRENDAVNALTGFDYVEDTGQFDLFVQLPLYSGGDYVAGFHATGPGVQLYWNGTLKATSSTPITGTYAQFSGTHNTGGGAAWMNLTFTAGDDGTYTDDVFAYPVDENGDLLCDPDFYPAYDPGDGQDTGGIPGPIGGAGTVCYVCNLPATLGWTDLAYWIAWLGCVIRNMFSCSLRVWLLIVGNWINGQIQMGLAWLRWIPLTVQQGANWFAGQVVPAMRAVTIIYDASSSFWDLLIAIVALIATLIATVSGIAIRLISLVIGIVVGVRDAFAAPPYQFTELGSGGQGGGIGPSAPALSQAGPNYDKMVWLFLIGAAWLDQAFTIEGLAQVLVLIMGGVALLLAIWTINFWREIISF